MRLLRTWLIFCTLLALFDARAWAEEPQPAKPAPAAEKAAPMKKAPPAKVTIGKDTTFITEPLGEDGFVDFLAAIDERASAGVTPENNAAIPFWQIVGPKEIDAKLREKCFQKLGIEPLPEEGDYFINFDDYLRLVKDGTEPGQEQLADEDEDRAMEKENAVHDQLDQSTTRPWTKEEFPLVAGWLTKNDQLLDRMQAATERTRFYSPAIASDELNQAVVTMLLPAAMTARPVAKALAARAMLKAGAGKIAAAEADLLAGHRLGRLIAQGQTLVESLIGIALDGIARTGDIGLSHSGKLSAEEALAYAGKLRTLPPLEPMIERVNFAERLMFIDCVLLVSRQGIDGLNQLVGEDVLGEKSLQSLLAKVMVAGIDWNVVLRFGNGWYDRIVAAGRETDYVQQQAAIEQIDKDLKALSNNARSMKSLTIATLTKGLQVALTDQTGAIMVSLLMPAVSAVLRAEHRSIVYEAETQLAFALAGYHADEGKYPAELAALQPKYTDAIPLDRFSGMPFHYSVTEDGYLLYSVGPNGEDDGGLSMYDDWENTTGDDLTVKTKPAN